MTSPPTMLNSWSAAQNPPVAEQPLCGPFPCQLVLPVGSVTSWPATELGRTMGDSWYSSKGRICTWRTQMDLPPIFWSRLPVPLFRPTSLLMEAGFVFRFRTRPTQTHCGRFVLTDPISINSCRDGTVHPTSDMADGARMGGTIFSKVSTSTAATFLP